MIMKWKRKNCLVCKHVSIMLNKSFPCPSPCKECLEKSNDGRVNCSPKRPRFMESNLLEYSALYGLCGDKPVRVFNSMKEMFDEDRMMKKRKE